MMRDQPYCDDPPPFSEAPSLIERTHFFEPPPPGFNPLAASDAELAAHGLPPRPDRDLEPELYDTFVTMFGPPLTWVEPNLKGGRRVRRSADRPLADALRINTSGDIESSRNWAGAYIEPNGSRSFAHLVGRWNVPDVAYPPGVAPSEGDVYASSTWIGLDGQRLYLESSLPQVGTFQSIKRLPGGLDQTEFTTWFQWWARGSLTSDPGFFQGFSIKAGDEVMCWMRVTGPSTVGFHIRNLSTNEAPLPMSVDAPLDPTGQLFTVSGATAEWIVERPAVLHETSLYPLADYSHVHFKRCIAFEAFSPGGSALPHDLRGARLIRMFDVPDDLPPRIVMISRPTRRHDRSFHVHYGGFKD